MKYVTAFVFAFVLGAFIQNIVKFLYPVLLSGDGVSAMQAIHLIKSGSEIGLVASIISLILFTVVYSRLDGARDAAGKGFMHISYAAVFLAVALSWHLSAFNAREASQALAFGMPMKYAILVIGFIASVVLMFIGRKLYYR